MKQEPTLEEIHLALEDKGLPEHSDALRQIMREMKQDIDQREILLNQYRNERLWLKSLAGKTIKHREAV